MKKTIWTTDHRTLEHYREMSIMPSECCFPGVDTLSCKGFTI